MTQAQGTNSGSRATADDMDEPVGGTQQTGLDADEKRKHPQSENALPSSQEKNPVPPESTRQ
ncbi:hypothetical protein [Caballeronia sp. Lep1P3]|uniref:hypothetical protein n=1 Tax=Caballeronia sp. Lep1P3 TaxID=2878150 RepID=UPI001FD5C4C9|nr:hypothetical protein [Caballeronia sp. Lep1P3]